MRIIVKNNLIKKSAFFIIIKYKNEIILFE